MGERTQRISVVTAQTDTFFPFKNVFESDRLGPVSRFLFILGLSDKDIWLFLVAMVIMELDEKFNCLRTYNWVPLNSKQAGAGASLEEERSLCKIIFSRDPSSNPASSKKTP